MLARRDLRAERVEILGAPLRPRRRPRRRPSVDVLDPDGNIVELKQMPKR